MKIKTESIKFGDKELRFQQTKDGFIGIVLGNASERIFDETRHGLIEKLQRAASRSTTDFVGYGGAVSRFLSLFPDGFEDKNYIGDTSFGEQHYKRQMSKKLQASLPFEGWRDIPEATEVALRMFRGTNLIDPFTKTAIQNVLRGENSRQFLEICEDFAKGEIDSACKALVKNFKTDGVAKWPALTYLPFFWKPDVHMFLKPQFTKEYSERVGHPFGVIYESQPNAATYSALIDMTSETRNNVSQIRGSKAVDNIDLHSFMWVVIDYTEQDVGSLD